MFTLDTPVRSVGIVTSKIDICIRLFESNIAVGGASLHEAETSPCGFVIHHNYLTHFNIPTLKPSLLSEYIITIT